MTARSLEPALSPRMTPADPSPSSAMQLLALILLAVSFMMSWETIHHSNGMDFYQYWGVGRALARQRLSNIYSSEDRQRIAALLSQEAADRPDEPRFQSVAAQRTEFETYQSPFLYFLLRPFPSLSYERGYLLFQGLCTAAGLAGILMWGRIFGLHWTTSAAAAAAWSIWSEPFPSELRVGNVNRLLLVMTAGYALVRSSGPRAYRDSLGGLILGLTLLFKPIILYALGLLLADRLARRAWRPLAREGAGVAVGLLLGFVLGSAYLGTPTAWLSWLEALRAQPEDIVRVRQGNFALAMLVRDSLGLSPAGWLPLVFLLPVVIKVWRDGRAGPDQAPDSLPPRDAQLMALGLLTYLLTSPLVWLHYLLLAIPAWLLVLQAIQRTRGAWGRSGISLLLAGVWAALSIQPFRAMLDVTSPYVHGWLTVIALVVLLVLALLPQAPRMHSPAPRATL